MRFSVVPELSQVFKCHKKGRVESWWHVTADVLLCWVEVVNNLCQYEVCGSFQIVIFGDVGSKRLPKSESLFYTTFK